VPDLAAEGGAFWPHEAVADREHGYPWHRLVVEPGSHLATDIGVVSLCVNSFHHQAVRNVGSGLRVVARDESGVVEGTESSDGNVMTLQCHPEDMLNEVWARSLFAAFLRRTAKRRMH